MGQIALWAAVVSFVLAGVMIFLTLLGFLHLRRVPAEEEFPPRVPSRVETLVTV